MAEAKKRAATAWKKAPIRKASTAADNPLMETLRSIEAAQLGQLVARGELVASSPASMRRLWSTFDPPQNRATVEINDRHVDQLIAFYPPALRRDVGACIDEVNRLAEIEGQSNDGNRLVRLYRLTADLITADILPVSLKLWVAIDRLDRAFQLQQVFRRSTAAFVSKRVVSEVSSKSASGRRKRGLKNGGKATKAEMQLRDIWCSLVKRGYGNRRGTSAGHIAEVEAEFGVKRSVVMRAIEYGKAGLFDSTGM